MLHFKKAKKTKKTFNDIKANASMQKKERRVLYKYDDSYDKNTK